jgi:hypothetical protein
LTTTLSLSLLKYVRKAFISRCRVSAGTFAGATYKSRSSQHHRTGTKLCNTDIDGRWNECSLCVRTFLHIHRQSRLVMGVCNRNSGTDPLSNAPGPVELPQPITKTNGAGNGNPTPTKQPPQTTPHPTPPTAPSRTSPQQPIQPTVSSPDGGPTQATTSVSGDQRHANVQQASETPPPDTTSTIEGPGSSGGTSSSQSLTQLPNPSSSLGGTLKRDGTSKGRIIAAVLGSVLGLTIIAAVIFLRRRRRRRDTMPRPLLPEDPGASQTFSPERNLESGNIGVVNPATAISLEDDKIDSVRAPANDINVEQLFQDQEFENRLLQFIQRRIDRSPLQSNPHRAPSSESLPPAYDAT